MVEHDNPQSSLDLDTETQPRQIDLAYFEQSLRPGLIYEYSATQDDGNLAHARLFGDSFEVNGNVKQIDNAYHIAAYDLLKILFEHEGAAITRSFIQNQTDFGAQRTQGGTSVRLGEAIRFLERYSGSSGLIQTGILNYRRRKWYGIAVIVDDGGLPLTLEDSESS